MNILDTMDELVGDEVAETVDSRRFLNKETDFSLKPGSSSVLHSDEMVTPGVYGKPHRSRNIYSDTLDGNNIGRIGSSEHASTSPHCMSDTEDMVEELTLRNYDGEKLVRVGASSSREQMQPRHKGKGQASSNAWEDEDNNFFSGLLDQNQPLPNHNAAMDSLMSTDDKGSSGDMLYSSGGIRTKVLSKSGFSEYFIKSSLRGKGVIHRSAACRGSGVEARERDQLESGIVGSTKSVDPLALAAEQSSRLHGASEPWIGLGSNIVGEGISLREWLEGGKKKANKVERLRVFRQVLNIVDISHSNGASLQDLRPSCFNLFGSVITYLGSSIRAGVTENITNQAIQQSNHYKNEKRPINQSMLPLESHPVKKQKLGESADFVQRWPQFPSRSGIKSVFQNVAKVDSVGSLESSRNVDVECNLNVESKNRSKFFGHYVPNSLQASTLEEKWYGSPELFHEKSCSFTSNIYCLGVLLFELLCSNDYGRSHAAAMQDLRHRILPPSFLSENPKEAGICLWLLHPEPSSRPTTREILQSDFVSEIPEISGGELLSSIDKEDGESELLSYFLSSLNEQKQKDASNLREQIQRIEADIQEVEKRRPKTSMVLSMLPRESSAVYRTHWSNSSLDVSSKISNVSRKETRLISNIKQLESAYFSTRYNIQLSGGDAATHRDEELLKSREKWCTLGKEEDKSGTRDHLGDFFDGVCKYARYSTFKAQGILRNGEFNSSANVICSLSFDRDEDYLATGGVSKKIKVYDFKSLYSDSVDIHYPIVEMMNRSKISSVCWNSYIRNYLASADCDGIVKLWDASTGQDFSNLTEHSARAWSVDFSRVDPKKLASGSDDRLVKLWSINDKNSLCTIRSNANVCCVQLSAESTNFLAFSSADYKTYCYDLRNVSTPWCILAGHGKAVSYAKFLDAKTLVSASTDNTLKIWDLSKTSSNCLSRDACILTLRGHANEKNFVGLSVSDGYIACGSETNEVYAYYKSLPMPITAHKFGSLDPVTGKETEDDNGQFVSSVCWRRKSNMVVAANSTGCIKLLQMV